MLSCKSLEVPPETTPEIDNLYNNPVVNYSLPNPSILKVPDASFYLYATEIIRNTPIHCSRDMVSWERVGTILTDATIPSFEPKGGIWTPDINYVDGRYRLYYSMSVWGGEWTCGIGVETADKPEGPFPNQDILFHSNEIDVQNFIDHFYIEDDGKERLFWANFRGLYTIEFSDG